MSPEVAAGWYSDPRGEQELRWWDGRRWTEHARDRGDAPRLDVPRPQPLFTSHLSAVDWLAVREVGFEALGVVTASSIGEFAPQAARLGADGVVGVRLEGAGFAGTAVRGDAGGRFFTSGLAGSDFAALVRSGHRPLAVVVGRAGARTAAGGFFKREGGIPEGARAAAFEELEAEARRVGAGGVLDVRFVERDAELLAIGTAIMTAPRAALPGQFVFAVDER